MISLLPDPGTYGATVVTGLTATGTGASRTEFLLGAAVVRASFDLMTDPGGGDVLVAVQSDDPARYAVRMADDGVVTKDTNGHITDFDFLRESDIAVEKARTDIVVEGFTSGAAGGVVRVDGTDWLSRSHTAAAGEDTAGNLFGWQWRSEDPRALSDVVVPQKLPPDYAPVFNNFYRRTTGFGAPGNAAPLPAGGLVEVFRTDTATDTPFAFRLPGITLSARLRVACDDCPDVAPRWRIADVLPMRLDTLVVAPAPDAAHPERPQGTAALLWRATWTWDDYPKDRLRAVQILRGS